jgi:hypothetical protein
MLTMLMLLGMAVQVPATDVKTVKLDLNGDAVVDLAKHEKPCSTYEATDLSTNQPIYVHAHNNFIQLENGKPNAEVRLICKPKSDKTKAGKTDQ